MSGWPPVRSGWPPAGIWSGIGVDTLRSRDGAWVAEITGLLDLTGYPEGTRVIVRREPSHPGAQLSLFDHEEGLRHLAFATDTPYARSGTIAFLEARHRSHARVEDRQETRVHAPILHGRWCLPTKPLRRPRPD